MKRGELNREAEPFFVVPSRVFDMGLTPYEIAVLFYLIMRSDNKTRLCFPSEGDIARACAMGRTTVAKSIKALEEKGLIEKEGRYQESKNGIMRQTANHYRVKIYADGDRYDCSPRDTPPTATRYPPYRHATPPLSPGEGEIYKTITNRTILNRTISTELTRAAADETAEREKVRESFLSLKDRSLSDLQNERGFEQTDLVLLDRALEYLWFKDIESYEGREYPQNELRELMATNTNADLLAHSFDYLRSVAGGVRAPVPYLAKCILGVLINGIPAPSPSAFDAVYHSPSPNAKNLSTPSSQTAPDSSFDLEDFFAAALRSTYGADIEL